MIPLVLAAVIFGTPYFQALVLIAVAILGWEWLGLLGLDGSPADSGPFLIGLVAAMAVSVVVGPREGFWAALVLAAAFAAYFLVRNRARAGWIVIGALYVLLPCWSILWLRLHAEDGLLLIIGVFVVVWAADIGAYAVGRTIGGPKLLPSISPNKTWSGLAGAMVSAAIAAILFLGIVQSWGGNLNYYAATALFAAIIGALGQFGDMVESGIKRRFSVKDMGSLIPGHGGLFDRVDGLMFVAPAIAVLEILYPEGISL
jgi:phosphatidate cytidylyltransferase